MRITKLVALGLAVAIAPGLAQTAHAQAGVTVSEIEDEPERYVGQNVTVSGEVAEVYGPGNFTIGGDDFFNEELLIVVPATARVSGGSQNPAMVAEGDVVQVSGQVRRFVETEIENDFDLDFDFDEYEIEYDPEEPLVVANQLLLSPRGMAGATISDIEDNPDRFMGRTVTVSGEVEDIYGPLSFTVGGDDFFGDELLVIIPANANIRGGSDDAATVSDGDIVQLSGQVRRFVETEIESDFDFDGYEIDYDVEGPAIVVDELLLTPRGMSDEG